MESLGVNDSMLDGLSKRDLYITSCQIEQVDIKRTDFSFTRIDIYLKMPSNDDRTFKIQLSTVAHFKVNVNANEEHMWIVAFKFFKHQDHYYLSLMPCDDDADIISDRDNFSFLANKVEAFI